LGLRILIVDDEPTSVETLRAELLRTLGATINVVNFDRFHDGIAELSPNIIVLDLARGNPADRDVPGMGTFEEIWNDNFCPLIFYTALPELLEGDQRLPHPFVRVVQKGGGSEERVLAQIRGFEPHLSAMDGAGIEVERALNQALKEVAPRVFETTKDANQRREMLVRSARRRVAAAMDRELSSGGPDLKSWEHYLYPPITLEYPLTGDIIRKRGGDAADPSQYAVVLTPSCDLASGEGRKCKVGRVLVAGCRRVDRLLQELAPADRTHGEERRKKLRAILTQGYGRSCLPLPALPGVFPPMVADFRALELIDFTEIANSGKAYDRIASVDSPFRELVSWAYVLCAARPGMPDRDFDAWVEEVVSELGDSGKRA
jgi:CheY-like chemotaxis protein